MEFQRRLVNVTLEPDMLRFAFYGAGKKTPLLAAIPKLKKQRYQ